MGGLFSSKVQQGQQKDWCGVLRVTPGHICVSLYSWDWFINLQEELLS